MNQFCPESEQIAVLMEGRLTGEETGTLHRHLADCDSCRREATLLRLCTTEPLEILPEALEEKILETCPPRQNRRRSRRKTTRIPARRFPVGFVAAAGLLITALLGILLVSRLKRPLQEPLEPVVQAPEKKPVLGPEEPLPSWDREPEKDVVEATVPEWPPQLPGEEISPEQIPILVEPEEEFPEIERLPEKKTDSPTKPQTKTRRFGALALLNPTGQLSIRRAGKKKRERIQGIIRVSNGDVIRAETSAAFCLEGGHAVALAGNTEVAVASSLDEKATWLSLRSGEILVEPDGSLRSRWTLSDERESAMVVQKTRSRFAVAVRDDRVALFALTDRIRVQADSGRSVTVLPGEEYTGGSSRVAAWGSKVEADLSGQLPTRRSLFFATSDPEDLEEGRWSLETGKIRKGQNPFLLSEPRKKFHSVKLNVAKPVGWDREYTLRFRYRTNAGRLRVQLPFPRGLGALMTDITVSRDYRNRWITVELPLDRFLVVATENVHLRPHDRVETIEFRAFQKDVTGSTRGFVAVDDVELLDQ